MYNTVQYIFLDFVSLNVPLFLLLYHDLLQNRFNTKLIDLILHTLGMYILYYYIYSALSIFELQRFIFFKSLPAVVQ